MLGTLPHRTRFLSTDEIDLTARGLTEEARAKGAKSILVGGAAMIAYGSPRQTTDVDFVATRPIRRGVPIAPTRGVVIGRSFVENGVTVDWLVRSSTDDYARLHAESIRTATWHPDLGYSIVRADYLLALKLIADRPTDREDIIWLLRQPTLINRGMTWRMLRRILGMFAAQRFDYFANVADWRTSTGRAGEDP